MMATYGHARLIVDWTRRIHQPLVFEGYGGGMQICLLTLYKSSLVCEPEWFARNSSPAGPEACNKCLSLTPPQPRILLAASHLERS